MRLLCFSAYFAAFRLLTALENLINNNLIINYGQVFRSGPGASEKCAFLQKLRERSAKYGTSQLNFKLYDTFLYRIKR